MSPKTSYPKRDSDKSRYPVFCAWCGRIIRYASVEHSHGICQDCAAKLLADYKSDQVKDPK